MAMQVSFAYLVCLVYVFEILTKSLLCVYCRIPLTNLLECGVSTPYMLFGLIRTITSELNYILIFTSLSEPESISADFQWTGSPPAEFQKAIRAACHWDNHCVLCVSNFTVYNIHDFSDPFFVPLPTGSRDSVLRLELQ